MTTYYCETCYAECLTRNKASHEASAKHQARAGGVVALDASQMLCPECKVPVTKINYTHHVRTKGHMEYVQAIGAQIEPVRRPGRPRAEERHEVILPNVEDPSGTGAVKEGGGASDGVGAGSDGVGAGSTVGSTVGSSEYDRVAALVAASVERGRRKVARSDGAGEQVPPTATPTATPTTTPTPYVTVGRPKYPFTGTECRPIERSEGVDDERVRIVSPRGNSVRIMAYCYEAKTLEEMLKIDFERWRVHERRSDESDARRAHAAALYARVFCEGAPSTPWSGGWLPDRIGEWREELRERGRA